MKPYYEDNHITIYNKDCRDMSEIADNSIQCVVTSPPYWGLRKYSGDQELIWGGDKDCEHRWVDSSIPKSGGVGDYEVGRVGNAKARSGSHEAKTSNTCSLCGAWKGSFGLEPTPELYIQHSVEIMREVKRVLRKDGVVWWNIGDSYNGSTPNQSGQHGYKDGRSNRDKRFSVGGVVGLKPKDMCLIPQRLAIAFQEDGWWIRSDIIWSKPNPMPESVTDRPTNSYEHILMLTQSGTSQYWTHRDEDGVRTQPQPDYRWSHKETDREISIKPEGWTPKHKMGWDRINLWQGHDYYFDQEAVREPAQDWGTRDRSNFRGGTEDPLLKHHGLTDANNAETGRNLRDVWEITTQPYPEAHFATFPKTIPELCIKAGTSEKGCCSKCGAPWERVVERKRMTRPELPKGDSRYSPNVYDGAYGDINGKGDAGYTETQTLGWRPTCKCNAEVVPCVALDPFLGSGTTAWVAKKLNRKCIGYELSEEYCGLARERNKQQVMELNV